MDQEVTFTRAAVARILGRTPLTIANRERRGVYPSPRRNLRNGYRIYSLKDVFKLQELSNEDGKIFLQPILVEIWDQGYQDVSKVYEIVSTALDEYNNEKGGDDDEEQ